MIRFSLNGSTFDYRGDPAQPLLWVLRDEAALTGTKFGCGAGLCGSCTVHIDGQARRACITPVSAVANASVTTIEGLADGAARDQLHAVQRAWIEEDVAQCGYCQAGQIMNAAALLARNPNPSDDDIDRFQTNLCRCGTYARVRKAIHRAAEIQQQAAVQHYDPALNTGEEIA